MALSGKLVIAGILLVAASLGAAVHMGTRRWEAQTARLTRQLARSTPKRAAAAVSFGSFEKLPAPVGRYFRRVLKEGQPFVHMARITQTGQFNIGEAAENWKAFDARQIISTEPPGFIWEADIRSAPLMKVRVRDVYLAGRGSMQGRIFSLIPVVAEHGRPQLNAGALHRYLAEAVWLPTALLAGERINWREVDDHRATASITDGGTAVSLEFHFNDADEITGVFTDGRYRKADGSYMLTPWAGYFRGYQEINGMRIPTEGEVEWRLPHGPQPYWKGRITSVDYDFAR